MIRISPRQSQPTIPWPHHDPATGHAEHGSQKCSRALFNARGLRPHAVANAPQGFTCPPAPRSRSSLPPLDGRGRLPYQTDDQRMRPLGRRLQLRDKQRAQEERMAGEFQDADFARVVPADNLQIRAVEQRRVLGVDRKITVMCSSTRAAPYRRAARLPAEIAIGNTRSTSEQGKRNHQPRSVGVVLADRIVETQHVAGVLDDQMLKPAASPQQRNARLAGKTNRPQRAADQAAIDCPAIGSQRRESAADTQTDRSRSPLRRMPMAASVAGGAETFCRTRPRSAVVPARRSSPLDPVSARGQRGGGQVHLPTAAAARGWPWNNTTNSATAIRMVTAGISQKVRQSVIRSLVPVAGLTTSRVRR